MKVLLIVVDAASPRVLCPALQTGRLRTLQRLAEAGTMHQGSVTIFPSITPAATTSIITGHYPVAHGIVGASWLDEDRDEIAYYGDDFWVIAREGFGAFVREFLIRLNGDRLKVPTLFEIVEGAGLRAACLNYLVFRGRTPHQVRMPGLLAMLPGMPHRETVMGPSMLSLGDFVEGGLTHPRVRGSRGVFHRFGMDDEATGALLCALMERGLPDFTVAYFADNDYRSHEVGPHDALPVLDRVDAMLGEAFDQGGGLERVLEDTCVLLTSDHGHCEVLADTKRAVVRLDAVLDGVPQAQLGNGWQEHDLITICPNMRAAQIYLRRKSADLLERVVSRLLPAPGVDQVLWHPRAGGLEEDAYVAASSRGRLTFRRVPDRPSSVRDAHGNTWSWTGEASVLDVRTDGTRVAFGDYPNAFERIAGALDSHYAGDIWVTAKPGCEFEVPGGEAHAGGASHGALHALDSLSPIVAAGGPVRWSLPEHIRSVDLAALCLDRLGLPGRPG